MPASIKHLTDKKLNLNSLLARWKDGLYYTAAIVKCDKINKKCLVCFEDGSEVWVNNRDVHIQLSLDQLNEDEDIVCCICDDGSSEAPNEIILCDVCQQGYHQKCHNPPVDSSKIDESEDNSDHKDWFCATCSYILNQSNRAKLGASAQQPPSQPQQQQPKHQAPQQMQTSPTTKQKPKQAQPPPPPQIQPQPSVASQPSRIQQQQISQKQPVTKTTKQVPVSQPQNQKTTVGPVKPTTNHVQKQAPYYPLSNQARVVATSSTAALASMTASSALVVGGSAGRTKQDLVNQSNRGSQRQQQRQPITTSVEPISAPAKHAVRKSSVNFVMPPVRQSALPTATRSVLPTSVETVSTSATKMNSNPRPNSAMVVVPTATPIASVPPSNNKISEIKNQKPSPVSLASRLTTWAVDPQVATLPLIHSTPTTITSGHDGVKGSSVTSSNFTTLITNTGGKSFTAGTESSPNSSIIEMMVQRNNSAGSMSNAGRPTAFYSESKSGQA